MQGLYFYNIPSPIGELIAVFDDDKLHALDLCESSILEKFNAKKCFNSLTAKLCHELDDYFQGKLFKFDTKIYLNATKFTLNAWKILLKIPYGKTISYSEQSGNNSYRAVANANAKNPILILVPCHRVLRKNGTLGGYRAGSNLKKWLIEHEKKYV